MGITINNNEVSDRAWGDVDKGHLRTRLLDALEEGTTGANKAVRECYAAIRGETLHDAPSQNWVMPHHELTNDENLILSRGGIIAAAAAIAGARAEPNLTGAQLTKAAKHILRHYRQENVDMEAPESLLEAAGEPVAKSAKLKDLRITKIDFVEAGANPDAHVLLHKQKGGQSKGMMKRLIEAIVKGLGINDAQAAKAVEDIRKNYEKAATFVETMDSATRRKVTSEIWDVCYALESSLYSIMAEEEMTDIDREDMMKQSVAEFATAMNAFIPQWAAGKQASKLEKTADTTPTPDRVEGIKEAITKLSNEITKGEPTKMSEETVKATPVEEDIYKGMHPVVKAEIERLRKIADAAEAREMHDVAKKYELIGKKAEELAPVLKSLKDAGGNAYDQMISVLDAGLDVVEKSGMFTEIGKRGDGDVNAWVTIEKHASDIQKSFPSLTREQAIDKACAAHPELVQEYESQR